MPLLQFLTFYQVLEFYFPAYTQSEVQRRLKIILKDPTFRADRDADIARLLSAIQLNRSGSYGDERTHLHSTIMGCVDPKSLRDFINSDQHRQEFYSSKSKTYKSLPILNPSVDLREDVAKRIYDIRCRIVHTKNDAKDQYCSAGAHCFGNSVPAN